MEPLVDGEVDVEIVGSRKGVAAGVAHARCTRHRLEKIALEARCSRGFRVRRRTSQRLRCKLKISNINGSVGAIAHMHRPEHIDALGYLTRDRTGKDGERLSGLRGKNATQLPVIQPGRRTHSLLQRRYIPGVVNDPAVGGVEI